MAVLRRTIRAHSWIALFAFLCGWTLPFAEAHPLGQDDAACLVITGSSGTRAVTISAATPDSPEPAHCPICHLTRAMSGAIATDMTTLATPFVDLAPHHSLNDSALTVTSAPPSSRGPPAIL